MAGETKTACGQLITVRATGSDELISTAHEEKEAGACPGDSAVSGDFLPAVYFIVLPDCGHHLYGISSSMVAST